LTPNDKAKGTAPDSSAHDMNCKNTALMAGQQVIDEIAND
jgi:hypothetical protein